MFDKYTFNTPATIEDLKILSIIRNNTIDFCIEGLNTILDKKNYQEILNKNICYCIKKNQEIIGFYSYKFDLDTTLVLTHLFIKKELINLQIEKKVIEILKYTIKHIGNDTKKKIRTYPTLQTRLIFKKLGFRNIEDNIFEINIE